jgi:hypothetical protein
LKTENAGRPLRIYEALSAVEQRRLSDIETGIEEDSALKNAVRGIGALRAERPGGVSVYRAPARTACLKKLSVQFATHEANQPTRGYIARHAIAYSVIPNHPTPSSLSGIKNRAQIATAATLLTGEILL